MSLKKEQSKKYIEEAELTIDSAQAVFEKAKKEDKDLWANVVKGCYDAIEQAVSSAIAAKEEKIPIKHPEKINKLEIRELVEAINNGNVRGDVFKCGHCRVYWLQEKNKHFECPMCHKDDKLGVV